MSKTVGILGGMGPEATADLLSKIIKYTPAKKDQDHIHVIVENNPKIPDRTNYILGKGENPTNVLIETGMKLKLMGAEIGVIPCNTAHFFFDEIKQVVNMTFINMIDEVGKYILKLYGNNDVGLLATEGTYKGQVYEKYFENYEINIIKPSKKYRELILELIYKAKAGIKNFDEEVIKEMLKEFKEKNIKTLILGCTELPIVFKELKIKELDDFNIISSTDILAKEIVRIAYN